MNAKSAKIITQTAIRNKLLNKNIIKNMELQILLNQTIPRRAGECFFWAALPDNLIPEGGIKNDKHISELNNLGFHVAFSCLHKSWIVSWIHINKK